MNRIMASFAVIALAVSAVEAEVKVDGEIAAGPFKPTEDSLKQYQCPDWFRDAKLGFWAHWGPQAVARQGDWYARSLYDSDQIDEKTGKHYGPSDQYKFHITHYGHPSKFGYKDIIPLWKAEKWDPEQLMALYKKAGAKYFVSMGSHHDNFFLWDSRFHRWNSVAMGPHRDVVGEWQKAGKRPDCDSASPNISPAIRIGTVPVTARTEPGRWRAYLMMATIRAIRIFMDPNRYRGTRGGLRATREASSIGSGL